jgi:hypothetical protein
MLGRTPAILTDIVCGFYSDPPGKCQDIISLGPWPLALKSFPIHPLSPYQSITYAGFAWQITMCSRFDDWVYWHFSGITVTCDSSHIELFLNDVYLMNLSLLSESLTHLYYSHSLKFMNVMPFKTSTPPDQRVPLLFFMDPLSQSLVLIQGNSLIPPIMFITVKCISTIHCLAVDNFVTSLPP